MAESNRNLTYFKEWKEDTLKDENQNKLFYTSNLMHAPAFNFFFAHYPKALQDFVQKEFTDDLEFGKMELVSFKVDAYTNPSELLVLNAIQNGKKHRIYAFVAGTPTEAAVLVREIEWAESKREEGEELTILVFGDFQDRIRREMNILDSYHRISSFNPKLKVTTFYYDVKQDVLQADEPGSQFIHDLNVYNTRNMWNHQLIEDLDDLKKTDKGEKMFRDFLAQESIREIDNFERRILKVLDFVLLLRLNFYARSSLKRTLRKNRELFEENYEYLEQKIQGYKKARDFIRRYPFVHDLVLIEDDNKRAEAVVAASSSLQGALRALEIPFSEKHANEAMANIIVRAREEKIPLQQALFEQSEADPINALIYKEYLAPYETIEELKDDPIMDLENVRKTGA